MKMLSVLTMLFALSSAHASYMHDKCSNASGSVKWESGHNSNTLTFSTYDSEERTNTVSLRDVKITEGKMVTIKNESSSDCKISPISSHTVVRAGTVTITASESNPGSLDNVHGKKIVTEVICERHINGMMYCPPN